MAGNPDEFNPFSQFPPSGSQYGYQNYPQFYSPTEAMPSAPSGDNVSGQSKKNRGGAAVKWTEKEDACLTAAIIQVSTDPVVGNNQKQSKFWVRVKTIYERARVERPDELGNRSIDQIRCRWNRITPKINKWVAKYREATRNRRSGESDFDINTNAHSLYKLDMKGNDFDLMHIWNIIRNYDKWSVLPGMNPHLQEPEVNEEQHTSSQSSKRSRVNEDGAYSIPSSAEDQPHEEYAPPEDNEGTPTSEFVVEETPTRPRPQGVKAAKRKGKRPASSSDSTVAAQLERMRIEKAANNELLKHKLEVESSVEIKRIELEAQKEPRRKMQILQRLLTGLFQKGELSPAEEEFKIDLMNQLRALGSM